MVTTNRYDDYDKVTEYLFSRLPVYQRKGPVSYKINLDTTQALDRYFGHPHRQYRTIHVAGTNGKGSVSHMLASVLKEAGYRTGLYTSPHLKDFRERIRINGSPVSKSSVNRFVREHHHLFDKLEPSFFEITVAMAFQFFAEEKVDVAVIETGLGGRLDSTNIITPLCSVITNIGLDHTYFLGNSLESIAREKAGIIKPGIPVVIGRYQEETAPVFRKTAARTGSDIFFAGKDLSIDYVMQSADGKQIFNVRKGGEIFLSGLHTDLAGAYQQENTITVLRTLSVLKNELPADEEAIRRGLGNVTGNTGLLGRWQVIRQHPLMICDTGHNTDAFSRIIRQIKNTPYRKLFMVLGFVNDKDPREVMRLLPKDAFYLFTRASIPRAMAPEKLLETAVSRGLQGMSLPAVGEAVQAALSRAGKEDMIFIGGSTFVVAEAI